MKSHTPFVFAVFAAVTVAFPARGLADSDTVPSQGEKSDSGDGRPLAAVVAVPAESNDRSKRVRLQRELHAQIDAIADVRIGGNAEVREAIESAPDALPQQPSRLGAIGEEAGVDRIVMARVRTEDGSFTLVIDVFHVADRLYLKTRRTEELGGADEVVGAVEPLVRDIYDRTPREVVPPCCAPPPSPMLDFFTVGSFVLAAGATTTGVVFGLQARRIEKDLESREKNEDGVYENLSQKEARGQLNRARRKATAANISYGLAGAFAVAGGYLFLFRPGYPPSVSRLHNTPKLGADGVGVTARFEF